MPTRLTTYSAIYHLIQTRSLEKLACQVIVSDSRTLVHSQTVLPDSLKAAVITEAENVMKEVIKRSVMTCHLCLETGISPRCTTCARIRTLQIIRQQTEQGLQILKRNSERAKMSKCTKKQWPECSPKYEFLKQRQTEKTNQPKCSPICQNS